jgi:uncharacterized protein YbjT (DUF2867 family)
MKRVFITGATGNIGKELCESLSNLNHGLNITVGLRDLNLLDTIIDKLGATKVYFDFTNKRTYEPALANCDILFLLRPPHIADVDAYFKPFIEMAKRKRISHIIFISVQGAEKQSFIPHHKIEKLILSSGIPYTFLRPAYFMQNFTSTLYQDIRNEKRIFLPAGRTKFTLVDTRDVGACAAQVMINTKDFTNQSYALTAKERLSFGEMASILTDVLGFPIRYESPHLIRFIFQKRSEKLPWVFIFVMIWLHYMPRYGSIPAVTHDIESILHRAPTTFEQFVNDYKKQLSI